MTVIDPVDLKVPGVEDNDLLLAWINQENVIFHENLCIGKSELGGIGLIYDNDNQHSKSEEFKRADEDIEILRIPHNLALDYKSLLKILDELKTRDLTVTNIDLKESELLINMLKIGEPATETEIIECYIIGFKVLKDHAILNPNSYYTSSPLRKFDMYLDIVCGTYTLDYPLDDTSSDPFIQNLIDRSRILKKDYESIMESLNHIYIGNNFDFNKLLSFETFYQIKSVIKSRTLEIPHCISLSQLSIKEEQEQFEEKVDKDLENEDEDNKNDFYINVTLVPILDFANHMHNNNSYFDIDLVTEDIILKLKHDRIESGKFEITINYSSIESIENFIKYYGFIPRLTNEPNHFQLSELRLTLNIENGELISKWLKILPQIQIIDSNNQVYFNFFKNNLPLLFMKDIKYNDNWVDEIKKQYDDENVDEIIEIIKHQEKYYDVVIGVEPRGILYKNQPIEEINDIIKSIDGQTFDELISKTITYIIDYFKQLLPKLDSIPVRNNFDTIVNEYHQRLQTIIMRIINTKNHQTLILPEELAQEEWETQYRTLPQEMSFETE